MSENIEKIIIKRIKYNYQDFRKENEKKHPGLCKAHRYGWQDGYGWLLTELMSNHEISNETFMKYDLLL